MTSILPFEVPAEVADLVSRAPSVAVPDSLKDLEDLAVRDADEAGWHQVAYEVPGKGRGVGGDRLPGRTASRELPEPYMRRRDPDCMVIGDERPTDKPTYRGPVRQGVRSGARRKRSSGWTARTWPCFPFAAGDRRQGASMPWSSRRPTPASSPWGWPCCRAC